MKKKKEAGRPTKYNKAFDKQVYRLCLLGATDKEISDFFEVAESTVNLWKKEQPTFSESIRAGKAIADMKVTESLFKIANGFSFTERSEEVNDKNGITVKTTKKHIPPNDRAIQFWLKNRRPDVWRDKQEIEAKVELGGYKIGFAEKE